MLGCEGPQRFEEVCAVSYAVLPSGAGASEGRCSSPGDAKAAVPYAQCCGFDAQGPGEAPSRLRAALIRLHEALCFFLA